MDAAEALAFVKARGIVLMSARGPAPRLVEAITGGPVAGSWWGHPKGREIYGIAMELEASPEVVFCPLLGGKVTLVHRRLWPALVRLSGRIGTERLARISSEHTAKGAHRRREEPFPAWVPPQVMSEAASITEGEAEALLRPWPLL